MSNRILLPGPVPGAIARPVPAPIGTGKPQQIPLEQLAQALMMQGVQPELQTGWRGRLVTIEARCGPMRIPCGFTIEQAEGVMRGLADAIERAREAARAEDDAIVAREMDEALSTIFNAEGLVPDDRASG